MVTIIILISRLPYSLQVASAYIAIATAAFNHLGTTAFCTSLCNWTHHGRLFIHTVKLYIFKYCDIAPSTIA
jgi:hypothetical protein